MEQPNPPSPIAPWFMLISRSVLFFSVQALIALAYLAAGSPDAWDASVRWWVFFAIAANVASVLLLVQVFRREGRRFLDILRFSRASLKADLLWFFGSGIIGIPLAAAPVNALAGLIFGDPLAPVRMMFRPLPDWAMVAAFLFPLTIAFAELPTYFGYVMPRLAAQLKSGWLAWLVCSLFLAAQHIFLPFVPDARFILWRLGMYLPFALFAGLPLKLRPNLLPYFAIVHALMDISTLSVYSMV